MKKSAVKIFTKASALIMTVLLCLPTASAYAAEPGAYTNFDAEPLRMRFTDSRTGKGIPNIKVSTSDKVDYFTDSQGYVSFYEIDQLPMNYNLDEVAFRVDSPGYYPPREYEDWLGLWNVAGMRLPVAKMRGAQARGYELNFKLDRINIAERLYRTTGQGIYRDTVIAGLRAPIDEPVTSAGLAYQKNARTAEYKGRIFWIWNNSLPMDGEGEFVSGAVSETRANGGLDAADGINYTYFADNDGKAADIVNKTGISGARVNIDSLMAVDDGCAEKLLAGFTSYNGTAAVSRGILIFNDAAKKFELLTAFAGTSGWRFPASQAYKYADGGVDYFLFCTPFPNVRVRADMASVTDANAYEALQSDNTWSTSASGAYSQTLAIGGVSSLLSASVSYNADAGLWVLIGQRDGNTDNTSSGSATAVKNRGIVFIATGNSLTNFTAHRNIVDLTRVNQAGAASGANNDGIGEFGNIIQHPYYADGAYIYFEGTFEKGAVDVNYSQKKTGHQYYEKNQLMYRVDLNAGRTGSMPANPTGYLRPCNTSYAYQTYWGGGWPSATASGTPLGSAYARDYCAIEVVSAKTGRGLPMVEVKTNSGLTLYTDNSGLIAFDEPGLMGADIVLTLFSYGYQDLRQAVHITPGGGVTVAMTERPDQIAERLYRVTGMGLLNNTILLGRKTPIDAKKSLNSGYVGGQDTVKPISLDGYVYYFWGDTDNPSKFLGNFWTSAARSPLPSVNGGTGTIQPWEGVELEYYTTGVDKENKEMIVRSDWPGNSLAWVDAPFLVTNPQGEEVIALPTGGYSNLTANDMGLTTLSKRNIMNADGDAGARLNRVTKYNSLNWYNVDGSPFKLNTADQQKDLELYGQEYLYMTSKFPMKRVPNNWNAVIDPAGSQIQGFTPLKDGTRYASGYTANDIDRDAEGNVVWGWKNAPAVSQSQERALLTPADRRFNLRDVDNPSKYVEVHNGTVYWNEYKQKYTFVFQETIASGGFGETWYSESESIGGPWNWCKKVNTCQYPGSGSGRGEMDFYNPMQHPHYAHDNYIYFEATLVNTFIGKAPLPRYDYNDIMYRLNLDEVNVDAEYGYYENGKAALDALIAQVEQSFRDGEFAGYTPESVAALQEALDAAKLVSADGNARQNAINHAYWALKTALDSLREYVPLTVNQGFGDSKILAMPGIYMGKYDHLRSTNNANIGDGTDAAPPSNAGKEGAERPVLWRPMGVDTTVSAASYNNANKTAVTVMSEYVLDYRQYSAANSSKWEGSEMQTWLNDTADGFASNFGQYELDAAADTGVRSWAVRVNSAAPSLAGANIDGETYDAGTFLSQSEPSPQKFALPWGVQTPSEANPNGWAGPFRGILGWEAVPSVNSANILTSDIAANSGFGYASHMAYTRTGGYKANYHLIGVQGANNIYTVRENVGVNDINNRTANRFMGVRPIFRLDQTRVLFAYQVAYGAPGKGQIAASADYAAGNYKLTLLDSGLKLDALTSQDNKVILPDQPPLEFAVKTGNGVAFNASETGADNIGKLVYKIIDGNDNVAGYGEGGVSSVTVEARNLSDGGLTVGTYDVYVWRQADSAISSNQGSVPLRFTLRVAGDPGVSSDGLGLVNLLGLSGGIYYGKYKHPYAIYTASNNNDTTYGNGQVVSWDKGDGTALTVSTANERNTGARYADIYAARESADYLPMLWNVMGEDDSMPLGAPRGDGLVTMLSAYAIDAMQYNGNNNRLSVWAASEIRNWLNARDPEIVNDSDYAGAKATAVKSFGALTTYFPMYTPYGFADSEHFTDFEWDAAAGSSILTRAYARDTGNVLTSIGSALYPNGISNQVSTDKFYLAWGTHQGSATVKPANNERVGWDASAERSSVNSFPGNAAARTRASAVYSGATGSQRTDIRWALRSPDNYSANQILRAGESINVVWDRGVTLSSGVRPLFKLDSGSVIYAARIVAGNPKPGEIAASSYYAAGNYKLTLFNPELELNSLKLEGSEVADAAEIDILEGGSLTLSAIGSDSANTTINYKIVQEDGNGSRSIVGAGVGAESVSPGGEPTDIVINAVKYDGGGLDAGTYTVHIWLQKNNEKNSDEGSVTLRFNINVKAVSHLISVDTPSPYTFPGAVEGYGAPQAKTVTVTNIGTGSVTNLAVSLSGANAGSFTLTQPVPGALSPGTSAEFTVVPNTGLAPGTYAATITVTGDVGIEEALDISFTVTPGELVCSVKSMLAKIAKLQAIPYTWNGAAGALTFTTSNATVCGVTQEGILIPMKAGIAVITIIPPSGDKVIFAVTVSV